MRSRSRSLSRERRPVYRRSRSSSYSSNDSRDYGRGDYGRGRSGGRGYNSSNNYGYGNSNVGSRGYYREERGGYNGGRGGRNYDRDNYGRRPSSPPMRRGRSPPPYRRAPPPAESSSDFIEEPPIKIMITRLTRNVTIDHIKEIFGHYGSIVNASLPPSHRNLSIHRGVAFVEYSKNEDAEKALKHMNKGQLDGNELEVSLLPNRKRKPLSPRRDSYSGRRRSRSPDEESVGVRRRRRSISSGSSYSSRSRSRSR